LGNNTPAARSARTDVDGSGTNVIVPLRGSPCQSKGFISDDGMRATLEETDAKTTPTSVEILDELRQKRG
jgi:hypothetical protein